MTPAQPLNLSLEHFSDPTLCKELLASLNAEIDGPLRFMEVCGSHTVSIFRSGLRSLLPAEITHLSGPGCPVCVTHESEIAAFFELAQKEQIIIATFGDLMRVPGPKGISLKKAQATGASIHIVYSPLDALTLAKENPNHKVVFLGIGFETTAPTIAATILMAEAEKIRNFFVFSLHKLIPPALDALLQDSNNTTSAIDAFLLPGHVSTILGIAPYQFIATKYKKTGIIGGFDPADILQSLIYMVRLRKSNKPAIINQYNRMVDDKGNIKAQQMLAQVFDVSDALWRGIGKLPKSGLIINEKYENFDAAKQFNITLVEIPPLKGCRCGDVLKGLLPPPKCPLFGKACTPANPIGPCMVSTEGSCAAYYAYQGMLQ